VVDGLNSPQIIKYQKLYREDPNSRVFAPLAEAYRKYGMVEDAVEILKKGIKKHPNFTLGHLGLALCYFDQKKFEMTYEVLRPLIDSSRDNIRMQKLYADCCLELGKKQEALETYKYLLFMSPKDEDVADRIKELEDPLSKNVLYVEDDLSESDEQKSALFSTESINSNQVSNDPDEWVRVDTPQVEVVETPESTEDNWSMEPLESFDDKITSTDNQGSEQEEQQNTSKNEEPMVSHTLVDMYYQQGLVDKAIEILEKIVKLNPSDSVSERRLEALRQECTGSEERAKFSESQENNLVKRRIEILNRFSDAIRKRKHEQHP
jgi:tetratricopeptide (TPR) repeat protein